MDIVNYFDLNQESINPPDLYLGGRMRQLELDNGVKSWAFRSSKYVQDAVKNVEEYLNNYGKKSLPTKGHMNPLTSNYRPEIYLSPELEPQYRSYYQSLIGIIRWIVELGRVDICVEVSMMSSHVALPIQGHFEQVLHIFGYVKNHHNAEMVFDSTKPDIDMSLFKKQDWSHTIYGELNKYMSANAPPACGRGMRMAVMVDLDHSGESLTCQSRTGYIIFLNGSPMYWFSKKIPSIDTSTFGAEFCAMKQAAEYVCGMRYKLRMMGLPCDEPTYVYGENQTVLANTSAPRIPIE